MVLPPPAQLQRLEHAFEVCSSVLTLGVSEAAPSALALLTQQAPPTLLVRTRDGHTPTGDALGRAAIMVIGHVENDALPQHLRDLKSRLTGSGVLALPFETALASCLRVAPTFWGAKSELALWSAQVAVKSVTAATLYRYVFKPRAATRGIGFVLGSTRPLAEGRYRDTIGRVATDYLR